MADTKISGAIDAGTLLGTDRLPLARAGNTTPYAATMAEVAAFASGTTATGLTAETARATAAEGLNATAIAAEVTNRTAAVTAEVAARNTAIGVETTRAMAAEAAEITYAQLPAELASVPLAFSLPGKPAAGAVLNVVVPFAVTVAAPLAGAVAYAGTAATAAAVFTVNRISGGAVTALGTVTLNPTGAAALAGAGGALAAGDVVQLVAPATQDATLADVAVTLLAGRV